MLELYGSGDPGTLKLVLCLEELGLEYEFHELDLKRLDHWSDAHRLVAPQGEVPVLIDGTRAMADATIALLHLAESHRHAGLLPGDPVGQYAVQALDDVLDAAFLASINLIGWCAQNDKATRDSVESALEKIPGRKGPAGWSAVWRDAESDRLKRAEEKIAGGVAKIEAALSVRHWLVGDAFTIADLSAFALVEGLTTVMPALVEAKAAPRTSAWLERMRDRPAVRRALSGKARPGACALYPPPP